MILRENIDEVIARTREFCDSGRKSGALIQVKSIDSIKPLKKEPLNKWSFPGDLKTYLDSLIESKVYYWNKRKELDDDLVPSISPWFGIAEHSAFVGGKVDFSEETSWHHPVIKDWSDLETLELREDNEWLRMVIDGLNYLGEKSEGRYALKLRGANGPMDIANALRGNDLFTDFYEYPDELHRLMEFSTKAAQWTIEKQLKAVGSFHDGILSGFDVWLPGNSMGHFSEDATTMISPALYSEFGVPYTARLCADYDNAFLHTHALGQHILPQITSIPNINFIEISNDPNCPRAIEICRKHYEVLKDKTVVLNLNMEEIKQNLELLKGLKTIIWYSAGSTEDATEAIKLVRAEL